MGIESIPFSLLEDSETADMDQMGDEAVPITSIWKLKKLEKKEDLHRLADIFKHASDRGYLDWAAKNKTKSHWKYNVTETCKISKRGIRSK